MAKKDWKEIECVRAMAIQPDEQAVRSDMVQALNAAGISSHFGRRVPERVVVFVDAAQVAAALTALADVDGLSSCGVALPSGFFAQDITAVDDATLLATWNPLVTASAPYGGPSPARAEFRFGYGGFGGGSLAGYNFTRAYNATTGAREAGNDIVLQDNLNSNPAGRPYILVNLDGLLRGTEIVSQDLVVPVNAWTMTIDGTDYDFPKTSFTINLAAKGATQMIRCSFYPTPGGETYLKNVAWWEGATFKEIDNLDYEGSILAGEMSGNILV